MPSIFDQDALADPAAAAVAQQQAATAPPADIFAGDRMAAPAAPAVTLSPGGAPARRGMLDSLTDAAVRGATFGLSDLAGAAGTATAAATRGLVTGEPVNWGERYEQARADQRARAEQFSAEHPWLAAGAGTIGSLAGIVPSGAAGAIPTLGRQIATGAGLGATTGAISGGSASEAPTLSMGTARDIAGGAIAGGAVGAALPVGGALAGRMISPLTRALSDRAVENQANRVIAGRVGQDVAAGGAGAPDLVSALANVPAGKPLGIVDVADPNLQALAGKVARQPGPGRTTALNAFGDRTSEAAPRIISDINQGITPETAFGAEQTLLAQRKAAAAPAYNAAYAEAPLNPDHLLPGGDLTQLMQRPSMKDATRRAIGIAQEEGRDPTSLGVTFNAAGDPVFQKVPSWQTLDYVKRGLDDHLDQFRNQFGRLQLDESGRAAAGTQRAFVDFLDQNNPAYAAARQSWAGPSASLAALKQGQNFRTLSPEQLSAELTRMSPAEQDFFRIGAADTLRQGAAATGDVRGLIGSNAATNRGASYLGDQLRPLFKDPAAYDRFVSRAQSEAQMLQTQARVIGGSPTAARVSEDAGPAGGALTPLVTGIGALTAGEPVLAGTQFATGLRRLAGGPEINAPEVNAEIARRLYSTSPDVQKMTLQQLMALPPRPAPTLAGPVGGMVGQLAAHGGLTPAVNLIHRLGLPFLGGQPPAQ